MQYTNSKWKSLVVLNANFSVGSSRLSVAKLRLPVPPNFVSPLRRWWTGDASKQLAATNGWMGGAVVDCLSVCLSVSRLLMQTDTHKHWLLQWLRSKAYMIGSLRAVWSFSSQKSVIRHTWLGGAVVRASDLWSTGCEFDSRPCTAGLVLGWVTVCWRVNHLGT